MMVRMLTFEVLCCIDRCLLLTLNTDSGSKSSFRIHRFCLLSQCWSVPGLGLGLWLGLGLGVGLPGRWSNLGLLGRLHVITLNNTNHGHIIISLQQ